VTLIRRSTGPTAALLLATVVWLPAVSLPFRPAEDDLRGGARARALAARQLALWEGADAGRRGALEQMRVTNPEWDFMGRTFVVMALGNLALGEPDERRRHLAVMDAVIDDTLRLEAERGMHHFLLPYARRAPFEQRPARSLFVEGEIAMMLAVRQLVEERPELRAPLRERTERLASRMEGGPVLSGESYPDECWTFCNTMALGALRVADASLGTDRSDLARRWVEMARARLVDERTGLLVSSYTWRGEHLDGPEGSSIFFAAHALELVDAGFARDQYDRARRELGQELLGFGWAREWPRGGRQVFADVDSGPIVPVVGASDGASGMAILGAASFDDGPWLRSLVTTLDFAAFPVEEDGGLAYAASNQVGDAVLLLALVQGPLWERARARLSGHTTGAGS